MNSVSEVETWWQTKDRRKRGKVLLAVPMPVAVLADLEPKVDDELAGKRQVLVLDLSGCRSCSGGGPSHTWQYAAKLASAGRQRHVWVERADAMIKTRMGPP